MRQIKKVKNIMKKITLFVFITLLATSCVTKKKYMIAENGRLAAIESGDSLSGLLSDCRGRGAQLSEQVKQMSEQINGMSEQIRKLTNDTTLMGNSIRQYQGTLSLNANELVERERVINELKEMINAQNERVQQLLNNVKDALLGFSSEELTVREQNGKIYVAMSDKLLFKSGSAKVDKRGEEALGKLAEVLNKQTDIDVYIEGHTDNKPISTAQFKDNWDLSVIRATSVVRILIKEYNVNPLQIQPSGRGEYMPVADNETEEGRSKNRRTEIIMAPKLDKLYKMLNNTDNQ